MKWRHFLSELTRKPDSWVTGCRLWRGAGLCRFDRVPRWSVAAVRLNFDGWSFATRQRVSSNGVPLDCCWTLMPLCVLPNSTPRGSLDAIR